MMEKVRAALQRYPRLKKSVIFKRPSHEDSFALTLSWPDAEADRSKVALLRFSSKGPDGFPQPLSQQVVVHSPSPTNSRVASLIVEEGGGEDKKKFRVEVWDALRGQIAAVQVEDVHGSFLAGEGISWHDSEDLFAYVADKKVPSSTDPTTFQYREDWGEQFDGIVQPSIYLFDLQTGKTFPAIEATKTQLHPCFMPTSIPGTPSTFALAYTKFEHDPFKLGLVYCAQRSSEVHLAQFQLDAHDGPKMLKDVVVSAPMSPGGGSAKSPRFSLDGSKLVFLSAPKSDTHQGPVQISAVDVNTTSLEISSPSAVLVDVGNQKVDGAKVNVDLYLEALPSQCFSKEELFLTTVNGCRRRILAVRLDDRSMRWIAESETAQKMDGVAKRQRTTGLEEDGNGERDICSRAVLGVSPITSRVLMLESTPSSPGIIRWSDDPSVVYDLGKQVKHEIKSEILKHRSGKKADSPVDFESILLYPSSIHKQNGAAGKTDLPKKRPLIVYPHGGPHSAFTTDYSGEIAFLCEELQAGILMVNYRGSIGPERLATLQSLPGAVGDHDVKDVMQALKEALDKYGQCFDDTKLGVTGGSHGGFLTAHLIGQHPDTFACAVLRNPVTDIAAMSTVTDIVDWCYVEALGMGSFDFARFSNYPPKPKQYAEMFEKSPMRYVDKVKTPTLIAIGDKDRRVPPSQGLTYHRALKVRGIQTTLLKFPKDSHPIDRAFSNEVNWTRTIEFMKKYLIDEQA